MKSWYLAFQFVPWSIGYKACHDMVPAWYVALTRCIVFSNSYNYIKDTRWGEQGVGKHILSASATPQTLGTTNLNCKLLPTRSSHAMRDGKSTRRVL